MNRLFMAAAAGVVMSWAAQVHAGKTVWDWETGTLEGWVGDTVGYPFPEMTIEPGHNSLYSMGVQLPTYAAFRYDGATIEPGDILEGGAYGSYVPMTEDFFVDIDRHIGHAHALYLLIYLRGEESWSRWITYTYDGIGWIEDLGDGWYRHHLANSFHLPYDEGTPPPDVPFIQVIFNGFGSGPGDPIRLDDFTIPEPATLSLLVVGALLVTRRRR